MTKLKRKLAGLNEFSSFETYIEYLSDRVQFTDNQNKPTDLNKDDIAECYTHLEPYFELIKPLTVSVKLVSYIFQTK